MYDPEYPFLEVGQNKTTEVGEFRITEVPREDYGRSREPIYADVLTALGPLRSDTDGFPDLHDNSNDLDHWPERTADKVRQF